MPSSENVTPYKCNLPPSSNLESPHKRPYINTPLMIWVLIYLYLIQIGKMILACFRYFGSHFEIHQHAKALFWPMLGN